MEIFIVFLPLVAAVFVGLKSSTISHSVAQFITCAGTCISAFFSAILFYKVVISGEPRVVELLTWIQSGDLDIKWALRVDSLTAVMLVVVTWVSSLVHIYSIGYMSHDKHPPRFMAYLSLFTFFMLMLVTSDNFLQLFLGWEGVGLCSYLLIGFWYKKESANNAAMKAFLVNRVGDFGFAIGVFTIFFMFGSIQFDDVFSIAKLKSEMSIEFLGYHFNAITFICIMLFIGAMGKSAQLGLHTWLPDAMEGPTPVSALIHAATMVTAGVFLVARCSPLFELSTVALSMVTIVGASTCIFAATIAITQNDIKKVIAYSTCSQLGYMFFACGVSAYSAGVFHLMTHGFFKALLFLGAGSVIHAMSDEQDMRNMGGIRKKIPLTYAMMMIGTLAIVGFPPLAAFYSKDMILEAAFASGHGGNALGYFAFYAGVAAAVLTAFYSWRLIFMTFHGKSRASDEVLSHVHESPKSMTIPLMTLAVGAVFSGMAGNAMGIVDADLTKFWGSAIVMLGENNVLKDAHHVPALVKYAPFIAGITGLILAIICYIWKTSIPLKTANAVPWLYKFLLNKWYFDELYEFIFIRPAKWVGNVLWKFFDVGVIDKFGPNGFAFVSRVVAKRCCKLQTGYVYNYAFVMLIGVVGAVSWVLYKVIG